MFERVDLGDARVSVTGEPMSPPRRAQPPRSAQRAADAATDHLERSATWHGLRVGDPVVVSGLRIRGADWVFRAHVRNRRNGTESIEVLGGRAGDRSVRSFEPERIYPVTGDRRRGARRTGSRRGGPDGAGRRGSDRSLSDRPSLAEAPQLPLG